MTNRRVLLKTIESLSAARLAQGVPLPTAESDRTYWTGLLTKLAEPVLENLARGTLKRNMPVECAAGNQVARRKYSHWRLWPGFWTASRHGSKLPWKPAPSATCNSDSPH